MGEVVTTCLVTGRTITTGIQIDEASFSLLPAFVGRVFCAHCQREHEWTKDKAWVVVGGLPKD